MWLQMACWCLQPHYDSYGITSVECGYRCYLTKCCINVVPNLGLKPFWKMLMLWNVEMTLLVVQHVFIPPFLGPILVSLCAVCKHHLWSWWDHLPLSIMFLLPAVQLSVILSLMEVLAHFQFMESMKYHNNKKEGLNWWFIRINQLIM